LKLRGGGGFRCMLSRGMGVGSEFGDGNFWEVHGVWERFGLFVMIWLV
jgi:hypothetical protein